VQQCIILAISQAGSMAIKQRNRMAPMTQTLSSTFTNTFPAQLIVYISWFNQSICTSTNCLSKWC